jgi:RimJ/RimL family protein N-acetyltransferase
MYYGFVHALWWVWLEDGRSVVSVPPGARTTVQELVAPVRDPSALRDPDLAERLAEPVDEALSLHRKHPTDRALRSFVYACDATTLRRHYRGNLVRLTDDRIPPASHLFLPSHVFPGAEGPGDTGGIAYGVVEDGWVVAVAYAHRSRVLEGQVADLGVETAPAYRQRGYAQTAVSAVAAEVISRSGEARYDCSIENDASIATARSVGFRPYGIELVLGTSAP